MSNKPFKKLHYFLDSTEDTDEAKTSCKGASLGEDILKCSSLPAESLYGRKLSGMG